MKDSLLFLLSPLVPGIILGLAVGMICRRSLWGWPLSIVAGTTETGIVVVWFQPFLPVGFAFVSLVASTLVGYALSRPLLSLHERAARELEK